MKLIDYLIREACAAKDWQQVARLVCDNPHLDTEDWQIRVYSHPNNIPEVIVEHGGFRRRWSSIKTGVITDRESYFLGPPRVIAFVT